MNKDLISRQQAIEEVKKLFSMGDCYCDEYAIVGMLNSMPFAQPEHCGDAVSRNAIVQKLNKVDRYVSAELRLCDTDKKFPQNEVFIVDDVYEEIVEQLPSVQPFHNITMTDVLKYIDDMPEDVWLEFTCCLECRGWELQRRTAKWCGGDFA